MVKLVPFDLETRSWLNLHALFYLESILAYLGRRFKVVVCSFVEEADFSLILCCLINYLKIEGEVFGKAYQSHNLLGSHFHRLVSNHHGRYL